MGKLIVVVSHGKGYLYRREGTNRSSKHAYIAKLNDIKSISERLLLSREEAIDLILELAKQRLKRTEKSSTRELMELILFDPKCTLNR